MKSRDIRYATRTTAGFVFPKDVLCGAAKLIVAAIVNITNQKTAATLALEWMPPMWKILAQLRRMLSGIQVGTEQAIVNRKLITYSCRIKSDTVMLEAVAMARSGSCRLDRVRRQAKIVRIATRFPMKTRLKRRRYIVKK